MPSGPWARVRLRVRVRVRVTVRVRVRDGRFMTNESVTEWHGTSYVRCTISPWCTLSICFHLLGVTAGSKPL